VLLASGAVLAFGVPTAPADAALGEPRLRDDDMGGLGIQLLDIPVARVDDPRALAYIIDHVKPGTAFSRRVEVRNTSPEPQHVELYAGAAAVEGNTFTASDARTGNELSGWVSLESTSIDLPAGGRTPIGVTVAVPPSASKGERYAAIWAQISTPPANGGNIGQIHRVGIRMYLDVGPGGEPPTDFRIDGLAVQRGTGEWPEVTAQVHNTGERALDMAGALSLSKNSGAVQAGPYQVTKGATIPPGQDGQVTVVVTEALPAGTWTVRLTLVSGTVQHTAEGTITLPVAAAVVPVQSSTRWPVLPLGAAAALVTAVVAGYFARWRRRRSGNAAGVA
jgi:hypothetical protein